MRQHDMKAGRGGGRKRGLANCFRRRAGGEAVYSIFIGGEGGGVAKAGAEGGRGGR